MVEYEDIFSENDKYLIEEYVRAGTDDFLIAGLGDKNFIVPYKYTINNTPDKAINDFKRDLLNFQRLEERKYERAGRVVRRVYVENEAYIVPFDLDKAMTHKDVAELVQQQAESHYNNAIALYRRAYKNKENPENIDFSMEKLVIYSKIAKRNEETTSENISLNKKTKKENINLKKNLLKILNKKYKALILAGTIAVAGVASWNMLEDNKENNTNDTAIEVVDTDKVRDTTYVDFMGRTHPDKYGNLARLKNLKSDIMVTLVAVEGFADKTYKDGTGGETIGIGSTFLLDENGKKQKLKMNDKITFEEAKEQQWRYIEKSLFSILGDEVGRSCSDKELIASVGAAYCWGRSGFLGSNFYKALKNGESTNSLCRKLTGFRTPIGLLKREYLLACCLNGNWTTEDLLKMPVLCNKKSKQYTGCSIYSASFEDLTNCKKDKDGKIVPNVDKDNYCTLFIDKTSADSVMQKICDKTKNYGNKYKTIEEIINVGEVHNNHNNKDDLDFNNMLKITKDR